MNNAHSENQTENPRLATVQTLTSESSNNERIDPESLLKFGSEQIISLFVPVSICMALVGFVTKNINFYQTTYDQFFIYAPFNTKDADAATTAWQSIANALIFISVVSVMTCVLVLLFKFRCYKFIHGYLIFATVLIFFVIFGTFFLNVGMILNIRVDMLTLLMFLWNFGVTGMIAIHWKAPLVVQQAYLIAISARLALVFVKHFPPWTTWVLLGVLAIWDLIAVLCPFGPLKLLVNMAQERNQPLFAALIYSTAANTEVEVKDESRPVQNRRNSPNNEEQTQQNIPNIEEQTQQSIPNNEEQTQQSIPNNEEQSQLTIPNSGEQTQQNNQTAPVSNDAKNDEIRLVNPTSPNIAEVNVRKQESPREASQRIVLPRPATDESNARRNIQDIQNEVMERGDRGVKLGLGDFVFYSLLTGRATLDSDPSTVLACYTAILMGMFITIILLAALGRALPALPISMALGILFYFLTNLIIVPFAENLSVHNIVI